MAKQLWQNNFSTTLNNISVSAGATSIDIPDADATALGTISGGDYYRATLSNGSALEIVKITGIGSSVGGYTTITITRAQEGTSALTYVQGDPIEIRNTKGTYEGFIQTTQGLKLDNTTAFTPSADYHPATKKYVDDNVAGATNAVTGPATTTEDYIPQWDSVTRKLKDGKPAPTGTIVGTTDTQTLTNKTLTTPTVNTPNVNEAVNLTATSTNLNFCKPATLPNSYLLNMSADTIKGRANGAGTGSPQDLTATQVRTIINVENGATADQTAAEIRDALETLTSTDRLNADFVEDALQNVVEDTTPQLGGMLDVNSQSLGDGTLELLKFTETASAVNEFTIKNAATGNAPELQATGDDTNIDLRLVPKGTGTVDLNDAIQRQTNFKDISEVYYDNGKVTSGTATIDYQNGGLQRLEVGGNITMAFSNFPATGSAGVLTLRMINGGSYTITWPADVAIITAQTTISANTTDDSFNDSASGFGTGINKYDYITTSGFTDSANNGTYLVIDTPTTSKIKVNANLVTESAGDSVTVVRKVIVTDGGSAPDLSTGDVVDLGIWSSDNGHNINIYVSGENMT